MRDETTTSQLIVTPPNQDVTFEAGTATFEVTSNTSWTVTENETWFSVSPMNGNNNGTLTVTYDENLATESRIGQITITATGGAPVVNVTVTQAGIVPLLTVTPLNQDVTAPAGATTFEVTSNTSWTVTESETWFAVTPTNGGNNGTLTVTYEANTSTDPRAGQITVAAGGGTPVVTVTVSQAGLTQQWSCGQTLNDPRDGQSYTTVQIGDHCWMAENLSFLPEVSPASQGSYTDPYYYVYDYQYTNVAEAKATEYYQAYGVLYNWQASFDACPDGWHLPTDGEWSILVNYAEAQGYPNQWDDPNSAGNALKSCRQVNSPFGGICNTSNHPRWNSSGTIHGFDAFNFSALPGGYRDNVGAFYTVGSGGLWWSSTESSGTLAWSSTVSDFDAKIYRNYGDKSYGFSVRCLRD
jgi:uncharacterized protein (TIGR02145 family)